jgi:hypothetical protein
MREEKDSPSGISTAVFSPNLLPNTWVTFSKAPPNNPANASPPGPIAASPNLEVTFPIIHK